jgi:4-amino-4-deoxy-L-arabinose transferase-like glycosyltransferase
VFLGARLFPVRPCRLAQEVKLRGIAAVAGFALGALAQSYLDRDVLPTEAGIVYLVAIVVAVWGLGGDQAAGTVSSSDSLESEPAAHSPTQSDLALVAVALAFALLSFLYSYRGVHYRDTLLLWAMGLVVFVYALLCNHWRGWLRVRTPGRLIKRPEMRTVIEILLVLAITALGFFLRFFDLETVPPLVHGDEAYFGLDAIRVLQGQISNLFGTGFQDIPILSVVPQAVVMRWFGANLFGLRLSSVITGTLTVPLLYLLARLMVSRPMALFVAFLLAVSSWDIHFSRVGLDNVQVSPPQVMAAYLLLRAMRTRRYLDFGLCGLATGLCAYLYYSARIVPVIVGVFLIYKLLTERVFLRQTGVQAAVLILAAFVIAAPQLGYYLDHSHTFVAHMRGVFIGNNLLHASGGDPNATLADVLPNQVRRMLLGYNYYPDTSGQYGTHQALLDSTTALFFLIGLGYAMAHLRQEGYALLVIWFWCIFVFAGVLIVGPPNAPRLLGVLPAICLLAGVTVNRAVQRLMRPRWRLAWSPAYGVVLPLVAVIACANYNDYFCRYVPDHRGGHPPTAIARYLADQGSSQMPYFLGAPQMSIRSSQVELLAPTAQGVDVLQLGDYLPLRQETDAEAVYLMMPDHTRALPILRSYYPDGFYETFLEGPGRLQFATFRVTAEMVTARQGLWARYFGEEVPSVVERREAAIAFQRPTDWPDGLPQRFRAEWQGSLYAPRFGRYRLGLEGAGEGQLWLGGEKLVEKANDQVQADAERILAKGWHDVNLSYLGGSGELRLVWTLPGSGGLEVVPREMLGTGPAFGLLGSYYSSPDLSGQPVARQVDPTLFFYISPFQPYTGRNVPFSVHWEGTLHAPTPGTYQFALQAHEGLAWLKIGGQVVIEDHGPSTPQLRRGGLDLAQGEHSIEVGYTCTSGISHMAYLFWTPPDGSQEIIPPSVLRPASIPFGDQ